MGGQKFLPFEGLQVKVSGEVGVNEQGGGGGWRNKGNRPVQIQPWWEISSQKQRTLTSYDGFGAMRFL